MDVGALALPLARASTTRRQSTVSPRVSPRGELAEPASASASAAPATSPHELHVAAESGDLAGVARLLHHAHASERLCVPNEEGMTPLMCAAARGRLCVVQALLCKGADVTALDTHGWTALMHAARSGSVAVVHHLVECGAALSVRDSLGRTAVHLAAACGRAAMVRYLHGCEQDLNAQDADGNTPLHLVVTANAIDAIRLVLRLGADRSVLNKAGQTAAQLAEALGHKKLQKAIASHRDTPEALLKPVRGPWRWLPLVLPVLLNVSVFASLLYAPRYMWAVVAALWVVFFYLYGARVAPGDGSGYSSPFAATHVVSMLAVCLGSYFALFAMQLPTVYLPLHLCVWVLAMAGSLALHRAHTADPGFISVAQSGLAGAKVDVPDYSFCESCHIVRPLRSKHCAACGRCCKEFDHHCPWIYNCVGRNNKVAFVVFLTAVFVCVPLYAFAGWVWLGDGQADSSFDPIGWWIFTLGYMGAHWLFVASLLLTQMRHIVSNVTTAESINRAINPHRYMYLKHMDRGCVGNTAEFCGTPCRDESQDVGAHLTLADAFL